MNKRDQISEDIFNKWWLFVGSGLTPNEGEDQEEHCKRVAKQGFMHLRRELIGVSVDQVFTEDVTDYLILGKNKKPDNYRAEGWHQMDMALKRLYEP